jgi:hypothetical protein
VEKAVDGNRLLRGEDPSTPYLEDAVHWVSVYTELLQGKSAMLASLADRLARMQEEEARSEIGDTDVSILAREVNRFQDRVDFWTRRRNELAAAQVSQPADDPA